MRTRTTRGSADRGTAGNSEKPKRSYGSRDDRPARKFSDRPARREEGDNENRPRRSFGSRDDRPKRSFGGDRSDRPARKFGDRPPRREEGDSENRPRRSFGNRDERPRRSFGGDRSDRPRRSFGGDNEDRPRRSFGNRDDRPARKFGDRPPRREEGDGENRPRRSFGSRDDRPRRSFGSDRNDRPRRSFGGDHEDRPRRSFGGRDDRPARRFNDRPARSIDERPAKPKGEKPEAKQPKNPDEVRLNKFISNSGICSRREADEYITTGLVTVNGEVVTELGTKVNPNKDDIRFNGQRLKGEKKVYIIMNKPKDFVTTTSDPHAEKNVMDLINPELCPERVFPVGRLDKSTTGVLLFTNDGELTETLTHPSYQRKKIYQVSLDKNLKKPDFDALLEGMQLEDGFVTADAISYVGEKENEVGLEIHSGRNRIVRRMFEHLGYDVKKLDRVYFAGLTKKNIRRGQWRFLTEQEVAMLKMGSYE